jgi:uncharacterized membrane protein YhaH (DUF805 family)
MTSEMELAYRELDGIDEQQQLPLADRILAQIEEQADESEREPDPFALYNAAIGRLDEAYGDLRRELDELRALPRRKRWWQQGHRTGAAARVNPDDIRVFHFVLAGSILLPIFTFAASFGFQREFGAYTPLESGWWWIIPCILELPLVVLTPMILVFRRRHESTVGPWLLAILLTAAASAINFAHAVQEMPPTPELVHWLAAAFIASWPVLTLVTFKFFARLAVKPERPEPPAPPARKQPAKKGTRR